MTREKRWTPGPWYKVHTHSDPDTAASLAYIANTRRPKIADELANIYRCDSDDSQEANAHLMAVAPELHQSHEWLLDAVHKLAAGTPVRDLDERIEYAERIDAKSYGETEEG